MDYKNLLVKYIRHVEECEGTNFIDQGNGSTGSIWDLTPEETEELRRLSVLEQVLKQVYTTAE